MVLLLNKRREFRHRWATEFGAPVLGGIIGLVAGTTFQLLYMFLAMRKKSGVLGVHTYTRTDRGLLERTEWNEGIQLRQGIQSIKRHGNYILFKVNSYLFHMVPRRSFATPDEFEAFWTEANRLWKAA